MFVWSWGSSGALPSALAPELCPQLGEQPEFRLVPVQVALGPGDLTQRVELPRRSPGFLPVAGSRVQRHLQLLVLCLDEHLGCAPAVAAADEGAFDGGCPA